MNAVAARSDRIPSLDWRRHPRTPSLSPATEAVCLGAVSAVEPTLAG